MRKIIVKGDRLEKEGFACKELVEISENGKCEDCNKEGEVFCIEDDRSGIGLCYSCLLTRYEGCKFEEIKELDEKDDMLLLMDFRQTYWDLWKKFANEQGYEEEMKNEM